MGSCSFIMSLLVSAHVVLGVLYSLAASAATRYFLRMYLGCARAPSVYYQILERESIHWLPLIFIIVPVAAAVLDYSAMVDFITASVYLAAVAVFYCLFRRGKAETRKGIGREEVLWNLLPWALVTVVLLLLPADLVNERYIILAACFIAQPSFVALMGLPAKHFGRKTGKG